MVKLKQENVDLKAEIEAQDKQIDILEGQFPIQIEIETIRLTFN